MANRSYLYATNIVPGTNPEGLSLRVSGISEWAYDIPLVYKLLLSGNPQTCSSVIWDIEGDCALIGEYEQGVEKLKQFLQQINHPVAAPLIKEALAFLENKNNKNSYFLLECTEIFYMDEAPPAEQNQALLEEILHIDALTAQTVEELRSNAPAPAKVPNFFSRLFGAKPQATEDEENFLNALLELGLGDWNNTLYYDIGG